MTVLFALDIIIWKYISMISIIRDLFSLGDMCSEYRPGDIL